MRIYQVWGDLSSESFREQYPTVPICDECIENDEVEVVHEYGHYDPKYGDFCDCCGKTKEQEDEEYGIDLHDDQQDGDRKEDLIPKSKQKSTSKENQNDVKELETNRDRTKEFSLFQLHEYIEKSKEIFLSLCGCQEEDYNIEVHTDRDRIRFYFTGTELSSDIEKNYQGKIVLEKESGNVINFDFKLHEIENKVAKPVEIDDF